MRRLTPFILLLILFFQFNSSYSQTIPFDSDRWQFEGGESRTEDYLGQKSLFLKGGKAILKDSDFVNGIVEFDVAFGTERGFMGGFWRRQDAGNFENFYIRPHNSGNPDANQYTPVFNGVSGWQLYYGEGYGAPVQYSYNEWLHVKIVVSGSRAEVYIVDMDNPALFAPELKHKIKSGKVGVSASNFAPAHFTNFSYTKLDRPELKSSAGKKELIDENTIKSWLVSSTFDPKSLDGKYSLTKSDTEKSMWTKLSCETSGLANLARVQGIGKGKNCTFARVTIISETEQVKGLHFGYSDDVKVFSNSQLIYSGTNFYRNRDHRYLGTIGYFDEIYLSLKKGKNEVWFAVTENFGGWGLQAKFENLDGISVAP